MNAAVHRSRWCRSLPTARPVAAYVRRTWLVHAGWDWERGAYDVGERVPCRHAIESNICRNAEVLRRLTELVGSRPGTSISAMTNQLVDEGLRGQEHPLVVFRDGPTGRRARLVPGPDVWEVINAVRSARASSPRLKPDAVVNEVS